MILYSVCFSIVYIFVLVLLRTKFHGRSVPLGAEGELYLCCKFQGRSEPPRTKGECTPVPLSLMEKFREEILLKILQQLDHNRDLVNRHVNKNARTPDLWKDAQLVVRASRLSMVKKLTLAMAENTKVKFNDQFGNKVNIQINSFSITT